jgi:hypothetical protein
MKIQTETIYTNSDGDAFQIEDHNGTHVKFIHVNSGTQFFLGSIDEINQFCEIIQEKSVEVFG